MLTNDLHTAQVLLENKEVLTAQERAICMEHLPVEATEHLFHNSWNNTWLNLNVYSEVEKERIDLQKEMGY